MSEPTYCKTCGIVEAEGRLDATGITTVCCHCGEETEDLDEKMKHLGNMLLRYYRPYSRVKF
jgi:RNA polymerase-binding transcription factor DksA